MPVPAGIEDGQTVRMNVGNKELFITFKVEKSRYFKRDGSDVHTDAEISLSQALLGGSIRIQGVYEDQTIQVSFQEEIGVYSLTYSIASFLRSWLAHHRITQLL